MKSSKKPPRLFASNLSKAGMKLGKTWRMRLGKNGDLLLRLDWPCTDGALCSHSGPCTCDR